jgi:hypothetical protein
MLPYCQQFCNAFPASSPSVWQRSWDTWRPLSPTSLARIRRLLQTACRTPRRLSVRRPLLYVTRTHPPTPHSAARTWWTPRSVSLLDDHTCPRRQQPHVLAEAAVCLGAPDCFAVIVLEHKSGCVWLAYLWETPPCTCGRHPLVPVGDTPLYLWETPLVPVGDAPCTCGRRPLYLWETNDDRRY